MSSGNQNKNKEALKSTLVEELKDLYSAENQLVEALPKMSQAAHNPELKQSFQKHLQQTQGQVKRLEQAFEKLGEEPQAKACKGMKGLVEEGQQVIQESKQKEDTLADLCLIGAAQKVEHYEISGYGTVRTMAEQMGESQVANLLSQTEQEERKTDELLTESAKPMLQQFA